MCKYLVVQKTKDDSATMGPSDLIVLNLCHTANDAFAKADEHVKRTHKPVEIFERISVGSPEIQSKWEGRRRPAIGNGV
jgi:hypothetical protein